MKTAFMFLTLALLVTSCQESKTTQTQSKIFKDLKSKISFLQRYMNVQGKTFEKLDFYINFQDNSGGMVPAPNEWDICLIAVIPKEDLGLWIKDLEKLETAPDMARFEIVTTDIDYSSVNEWYKKSTNSYLGISREKNIIFYSSQKY